jgi:hypothetical protein
MSTAKTPSTPRSYNTFSLGELGVLTVQPFFIEYITVILLIGDCDA